MASKKTTTDNTAQSRKRQAQVEDGAYDGRYSTKVVEDKKKKQDRESCRKFSKNDIDED